MATTTNSLERRRARYSQIGGRLALVDNDAMLALLRQTEDRPSGWGANQTIELDGTKVFVKRVPVTEIEHANWFCTKNIHELPTYYNYGVGSAGFGVFRELIAHIKTTNWVLEGACPFFPIMFHSRILPAVQKPDGPDEKQHNDYVEYWNGNTNVGRYILNRAAATHEAVIFLEYIPHTVRDWMVANPQQTELLVSNMCAAIGFLRANGMIHFDVHLRNIVTDGSQFYLTDFGLALDRNFALSSEEQSFFKKHVDYDYGELIDHIGLMLTRFRIGALPDENKSLLEKRFGIQSSQSFEEIFSLIVCHRKEIEQDGILKFGRGQLRMLEKYHDIIVLMDDFYRRLRENKLASFPNVTLRRLLKEAGVIAT